MMCHRRTGGAGRGSWNTFQCIHLVAGMLFASLTYCVSFGFSFQPLPQLPLQPQHYHYYWKGRTSNRPTGTSITKQQQHQLQSSNTPTEGEGSSSSSSSNESIEDTLSKMELQKIEASRSLIRKRTVQITAVPAYTDTDTLLPGSRTDNDDANDADAETKIIHFQRHGQGTHNVLYQSWSAIKGNIMDWDSKDPQFNPLLSDDIIDAPLTEVGIQQCLESRFDILVDLDVESAASSHSKSTIPHSNGINPQLIFVSPLQRAIQSAELSWEAWKWDKNKNNNDSKRTQSGEVRGVVPTVKVPWIAHEGCREELGLLKCNERRKKSIIEEEYPTIDFSLVLQEEDVLFLHDRRETDIEKTNRIYEFLTQYVRHVPQREVVVVCHSAWLFHMCNAVMDIPEEHPDLKTWFATAEIRSMKVTFTDI